MKFISRGRGGNPEWRPEILQSGREERRLELRNVWRCRVDTGMRHVPSGGLGEGLCVVRRSGGNYAALLGER